MEDLMVEKCYFMVFSSAQFRPNFFPEYRQKYASFQQPFQWVGSEPGHKEHMRCSTTAPTVTFYLYHFCSASRREKTERACETNPPEERHDTGRKCGPCRQGYQWRFCRRETSRRWGPYVHCVNMYPFCQHTSNTFLFFDWFPVLLMSAHSADIHPKLKELLDEGESAWPEKFVTIDLDIIYRHSCVDPF